MSNPDLPQDIMFDIFLRLPVKSVGKCRCLSKTWRTQLSTKEFNNSHLNRQQEKPIIFDEISGSLYMLTLLLESYGELPKATELGFHKWECLLGSCNGLILLRDITYDMFVVNPVTHQQVHILPRLRPNSNKFRTYGFGYDAACDDYKVVTGDYPLNGKGKVIFKVYSLRKRVWKKVGNFPPGYFSTGLVMRYVNGALHWLARTKDSDAKTYRLDAFDLVNETFHQVPIPTELSLAYRLDLVVLKGCLSIVYRFNDGSAGVWMLKEYGVMDSWVRYRFHVNVIGAGITPLCLVGDEELLCVCSDDKNCWIVCDLKEDMAKQVACGRYPLFRAQWGVFVESLVSVEQGTDSS